jgi:hypothetical protein
MRSRQPLSRLFSRFAGRRAEMPAKHPMEMRDHLAATTSNMSHVIGIRAAESRQLRL